MTCYPNSLALHRQGISREEAVELIGTVVVNEIYNVLKEEETSAASASWTLSGNSLNYHTTKSAESSHAATDGEG